LPDAFELELLLLALVVAFGLAALVALLRSVLVDVEGVVVGDVFAVCANTGAAARAETSADATRRDECFMAFTFR